MNITELRDNSSNLNRCNACGKVIEVAPDCLVPEHSILRGGRNSCKGVGFLPMYDEKGLPREPEKDLFCRS